ncbi:MAG TPA: glycosyltransferase family 4 protein [Vicinamibacterales bacterium]|nr:glycosyltransferase family 4 protein [Vicinamibacterales bacterium]
MSLYLLTLAVMGLSAGGTYAIREYSNRRGLLDQPNERSSHTVPTPRLGGVAIALTSVLGWLGLVLWFADSGGLVLAVAGGGLIAAFFGVLDDLWSLSPATKLAGQLLSLMVPVSFVLTFQPAPHAVLLGALALMVLSYMNFFNFMDGSDGLAGGTATCSALGLAVLAAASGEDVDMWLAMVLAAAAAGFLVFNWPRASIFMGDGGSLFLGYSLAVTAILLPDSTAGMVRSLVVLTPFFFDAGFTLLRRAARGEVLWRPHRSHLYQRLLISGASHLHVASLYLAWAAICSALAWASLLVPSPWAMAILLSSMLPGVMLVFNVQRRECRLAEAHRRVVEINDSIVL